jgi:hypothetical protein
MVSFREPSEPTPEKVKELVRKTTMADDECCQSKKECCKAEA